MIETRKMVREITCCADCWEHARLEGDQIVCMHPENEHVSVQDNLNGAFHKDCPLEVCICSSYDGANA